MKEDLDRLDPKYSAIKANHFPSTFFSLTLVIPSAFFGSTFFPYYLNTFLTSLSDKDLKFQPQHHFSFSFFSYRKLHSEEDQDHKLINIFLFFFFNGKVTTTDCYTDK